MNRLRISRNGNFLHVWLVYRNLEADVLGADWKIRNEPNASAAGDHNEPTLGTVWLQVRVLPGPPVNQSICPAKLAAANCVPWPPCVRVHPSGMRRDRQTRTCHRPTSHASSPRACVRSAKNHAAGLNPVLAVEAHQLRACGFIERPQHVGIGRLADLLLHVDR